MVNFSDSLGNYAECGTNTWVMVNLKTLKGALRRARNCVQYKEAQSFRVFRYGYKADGYKTIKVWEGK